MCGLAGFIGSSKKPFFSNLLISKLFEKSEKRGIDAAGFWATQSGEKGKIFYYKEPLNSSLFIKNQYWQEILTYNIDLVLVHARGASKGVGAPEFNENNHPFISNDKLTALIHNGRIEDKEYNILKARFKPISECDSEVLLRIYEVNKSIKDIFDLIQEGHMAVAIGERCSDKRVLWIFRNEYRPLWVVDVKEDLNQIFFVSEPSIWFESIEECKFRPKKQKLLEVPTEEIWKIQNNLEVEKSPVI